MTLYHTEAKMNRDDRFPKGYLNAFISIVPDKMFSTCTSVNNAKRKNIPKTRLDDALSATTKSSQYLANNISNKDKKY
jgi:hypothetical protein